MPKVGKFSLVSLSCQVKEVSTKMKFQSTISLLSLALSSVVTAAPNVGVEVNSAFPIGFSKHKNARTVGRLFEIDGKIQYFAGELL